MTGSPPAPWDGVVVGDSFAVTYVFDTEAPDHDTSFQNGRYDVISLSVALNGIPLLSNGPDEIILRRTGFDDEYIVQFFDFSMNMGGNVRLTGHQALTSDSLPTTIDLIDWHLRIFEFGNDADGLSFRGIIDAYSSRIVPGPGTLCLVILSGLFQGQRKRRDHRP